MTEASMDQIVQRLETIHRALRAPPANGGDHRIADAVAACLRDLHTIAAQTAGNARVARPHLRLIDGQGAAGVMYR